MAVTYRTWTGVELGSVGMRWRAATGDVTFTFEHLNDVMRAANDDPHIRTPRLKLGHLSPINGDDLAFPVDPFIEIGDAAPAFGKVVNLRFTNDGATLVGDLVNVPDWINESSYPSRSGEWTFDVETPGGKRYSCVLTAMAMLGVALPAIADLDDLEALLSDGPDAVTTAITAAPTRATVARRHLHTTRRP